MLQSILFFILGFLCSGFLALMIAPAIWRRAVVLTRRRIEASMPLSLAELQADKDRMRAELAMTIRRLEISVKSLREKSAAQAVELGRSREELKRLAAERDERSQGLSQHEAKAGELGTELESHKRQAQILAGKLADAEQALKARADEIDRGARLHEQASFAASSRQIELVARESEVEKLSGELAELGSAREAAERRHREQAAETLRARQEHEAERRKSEQLGRQLAELRERLNGNSGSEAAEPGTPAESQEIALPGGAADAGDGEALVSRLAADRDRLQEKLTATMRENRRLQEHSARADEGGDRRQEDALLREQISDLAAEVIRLVAQLDGPGSPISRALSAPPAPDGQGDAAGKTISLADRVRALQRAASG